jgi:hypothetical protein
MDKRAHLAWRGALAQALAQALPDDQREHPDAAWLNAAEASAPHELDAVLGPLIGRLQLSLPEQVALALALWAEVDARWSALLALLQGHGPHRGPARPTLGLIAAMSLQLGPQLGEHTAHSPLGALLQGPAAACGLLQAHDTQAPAHARTLQIPPALLGVLLADGRTPAHGLMLGRLGLQPVPAAAWCLPQAWRDAARRLADACGTADDATASVLVLRGPDRDELLAVAAQIAQHLGRRALLLEWQDDTPPQGAPAWQAAIAREAAVPVLMASQGLAVWQAPLTPGRAIEVPAFAHLDGPLIVLADGDAAVHTRVACHEFELSGASADDRLAVWAEARAAGTTPQAPSADERRVVARSHCGISVLARAAREAAQGAPAHEAIEHAVRHSARGLSAWAQVSQQRVPADAWVGSPDLHRELGLLLARCVARETAAASLGPLLNGRLNAGVKALFIGASGTGKTLAAQWLADRLARPLVRVDLASVVSKYIGETEKNLAQLLARAEHLDAVLLFDEADSLFGARTDVKQANDRYANMQTNYLLQRLETFHGVAVLTSNSKARFDEAFLRRLDTVIEFPLPDVAERRALWALHLGDTHGLDASLMNQVAALADLPGGHIRNAVLTSALLARLRTNEDMQPADEATPLRMDAADLREALALEYRKLGQRAPERLQRP